MLRFSFILCVNLSLIFLTLGEDYYGDDSSAETDNVKITDVLKMIVLPPANEMKNILTSGNGTKPHDSPRLDFILQALEYWRKHSADDDVEQDLADDKNATRLTFNLRDDLVDSGTSRYSHLSKKVQDRPSIERKSGLNGAAVRRFKRGGIVPVPYIYVKNLFFNGKDYTSDDRSKTAVQTK